MHQDIVVSSLLENYRELRQSHFIFQWGKKLHPQLLDYFLAYIDSIYELKLPHLLSILSKFKEAEIRELKVVSK